METAGMKHSDARTVVNRMAQHMNRAARIQVLLLKGSSQPRELRTVDDNLLGTTLEPWMT
jgi:hypothetical protein